MTTGLLIRVPESEMCGRVDLAGSGSLSVNSTTSFDIITPWLLAALCDQGDELIGIDL